MEVIYIKRRKPGDIKQVESAMIRNAKTAQETYYEEHPDSVIRKFESELRNMGFDFEIPVQVLNFMPRAKAKIVPLAISYYKIAKYRNEKSYFMSIFHYRGITEVVPMLLSDFYTGGKLIDRWAIADCLYAIADKERIDDYIKIISEPAYGISRQMLVLLIGKLHEESAIPVLIKLLHDPDVAGHAIHALGQYKNPEFIPLFEQFLENDKSFYRREAKAAIKKTRAKVAPK